MKKIIIFAFAAIFLISCEKDISKLKDKLTTNDNVTSNTESPVVEKEKEPEKFDLNSEIKKYNTYVNSYNRLSNFQSDFDYYFSAAGKSEKMQTKRSNIRFRLNESFINNFKKNIDQKPEMPELDQAAAELLNTLEEFLPLFEEISNYYVGKDFLNDKYAKGQEFHVQLIEASKKYDTVTEKFMIEFNKKANEIRIAELEHLQEEGKLISYNRILLLITCENIMSEISNQKLHAGNVTKADISKIKPLYDTLNENLTLLQNLSKDDAAMEKEGYKKESLKSFLNKTLKFKGSVISLIDRVENKKPVNEFNVKNRVALEHTSGTPEEVRKLFNEIIDAYNRLNR